VVKLGGGRTRPEDDINLSVGLEQIVRLGNKVEAGDPLCRIHAPSESTADHVCDMIGQAIVVDEEPVALSPAVIEQVR
jgi:thymidine phosphorylase